MNDGLWLEIGALKQDGLRRPGDAHIHVPRHRRSQLVLDDVVYLARSDRHCRLRPLARVRIERGLVAFVVENDCRVFGSADGGEEPRHVVEAFAAFGADDQKATVGSPQIKFYDIVNFPVESVVLGEGFSVPAGSAGEI